MQAQASAAGTRCHSLRCWHVHCGRHRLPAKLKWHMLQTGSGTHLLARLAFAAKSRQALGAAHLSVPVHLHPTHGASGTNCSLPVAIRRRELPQGCRGPVQAVVAEHWAVYTYWNAAERRHQVRRSMPHEDMHSTPSSSASLSPHSSPQQQTALCGRSGSPGARLAAQLPGPCHISQVVPAESGFQTCRHRPYLRAEMLNGSSLILGCQAPFRHCKS